MEHAIAPPGPSTGLSALVASAEREPGRVLGWLLGFHLVVWSLLPLVVCRNLQLDLAEGLALGKEWQLGYWKHPPLPWWLDDLAYRIIGDVRVVYLLGPLAAVVALWAVWRLGRAVAGPFSALIAVMALEGLHFFNFTAVKFNHDVMQLPLWALTGLTAYRAIAGGRAVDWIVSGGLLALAFWTKYSVLALAAPLGLVLLLDPLARRAWRTPGPYLMAATFLVAVAPHLVWLVDHGFLPLHYADVRAKVAEHWYDWLVFPLRWTVSQLFFLLPTIGLMAILLAGARRIAPARDAAEAFARRYVTALALGPFVVVTLGAGLSGRLAVAMWGYPLWTFLPLAALMWFHPLSDVVRLRLFARAFIVVMVAMPLVYAGSELLEPFVRDRPKATQFPGKLLADTLTRQWRETTGTPLTYVAGAELGASGAGEFAANTVAVYSSDRPHVVAHGEPAWSPWIDRTDLDRRGAVLVWEAIDATNDLPANLKRNFPRAEVQPPLILRRLTLHSARPAIVNYALVRALP